jgi:perosamine synthetase
MNVPHNRLTHGELEANAVLKVVRSGIWANGPEVAALERDLSAITGRAGAVAVGSGLAALRLSLLGLGVGAKDEVIIPAYACVALANAVLAVGAKPVVADSTAGEWTIDPVSAASVVNGRTRAMVAVHTFGYPADIAALRRTGIPVIEDCAHGLKMADMGRRGDVVMSSFYATKLIGAGEGGSVMTDREDVLQTVRQWRDYGDRPADGTRLNDKMTEMSAALARCQIERLDTLIAQRKGIARRYLDALKPLADKELIVLPPADKDRVWYRFVIEAKGRNADDFVASLWQYEIGGDIPVWDWRTPAGAYSPTPIADHAYRRVVSLPLYPTLDAAAQDDVVAAVFRTCKTKA